MKSLKPGDEERAPIGSPKMKSLEVSKILEVISFDSINDNLLDSI